MARATRSKPKPKEPTPEPAVSTVRPLPASTSNPPKLFVLPKDTSKDARIVTLDNPANGAPSRYFFCPNKGFYEFTRIQAPKKECRSWLIAGEQNEEEEEVKEGSIGSGYVTKSADMFIATPIDLLFLILPALSPATAKDSKQLFLALDDHIDTLSSSSRHWRALLAKQSSLKTMIEKRMRAICDTVDAGDESMYRISQDKLLQVLLAKANRMVSRGLPPSLEEKYIKTALEVPVMSIMREESSLSGTGSSATDNTTTGSSGEDSQTSVSTTLTTPDDSVPSAPKPALDTPTEIPHLLRLQTSLTYLSSTYLPPSLRSLLTSHLSTSPTFTPLSTHLSTLSKLKSEASALRSISDNISRKRGFEEDEEKMAEREEKKRKKEEEEKKKKSEGRGVKQLKKVDTSGMRKMSSFFTKVDKKA